MSGARRVFCPYCGAPVPAGAPACGSHRDLAQLEARSEIRITTSGEGPIVLEPGQDREGITIGEGPCPR